MLTGHERNLVGVIHVFAAQKNHATMFYCRSMKKLSIDAVNYGEAAFFWNSTAFDQKVAAAATDVDLAQQGYKPQWGLSTAYAYRSDERVDRDDFLSVGFSFDLPIFTGRRQDQQVAAATRELESMRLERVLVLRALRADFAAVLAEHQRLQERLELYSSRLLREMDEQAEASLQAYTNDDGDFAEAVRARIADLNARIDVFSIEVSLLSLQARANYLLAGERPATETVGASNHE